MESIELDQGFFDSVKNHKREDVVNGIVRNIMNGVAEYECVGESWNLQGFVNDALGEKDVSERMSWALTFIDSKHKCRAAANSDLRAIDLLFDKVESRIEKRVQSFCNQNDVGIA